MLHQVHTVHMFLRTRYLHWVLRNLRCFPTKSPQMHLTNQRKCLSKLYRVIKMSWNNISYGGLLLLSKFSIISLCLLTWNNRVNVLKKVWKLWTSSNPNLSLTFLNIDIPNTANINMTRKRRRQIFIRAGKAMTSENNNVRMPFAPLIRRKTRPTLATRT